MTKPRIAFLVLLVLLSGAVLFYSRAVLFPFGLAFFLAYSLNPLVEFLQNKGAPRDWAIITVYLIVFLSGAFLIQLLAPLVIRDLIQFLRKLPFLIRDLQGLDSRMSRLFKDWQIPVDWRIVNDTLITRGEVLLKETVFQIGQWIVNFFSRSLVYILVPLLAYYMSRDYPHLKDNLMQWVKRRGGPLWTNTVVKIDTIFRLYIRCQIVDMAAVGLLIGLGLSILGFEAAFFLGMLAGILNLIPYFGPVLGAIPALLYALGQSPWMAVYVIILFLVVNQLEVMFLAPRIMAQTFGLHPLAVIFLILAGGSIFGLPGMIFAVPLGAIALSIIHSLYSACFEGPAAGKRESD